MCLDSKYESNFFIQIGFPMHYNITKYEALLLGLQFLKQLEAQNISILGDSELIIKQIKGEYSARNPRLREYRNATVISRKGNRQQYKHTTI